MSIHLAELTEEDLPFVRDIYNYYTLHTTVVYFIDPVPMEEIREIVPLHDPRYRSFLVRDEQEERLGFCYFARFKEKPAFGVSVEVTVYLHPDRLHKGAGYEAMRLMEPYIKEGGFTNAMALIDAGNTASIRMFERCGYHCCAEIKDVAEKFGKRLTLMMYQKLF